MYVRSVLEHRAPVVAFLALVAQILPGPALPQEAEAPMVEPDFSRV